MDIKKLLNEMLEKKAKGELKAKDRYTIPMQEMPAQDPNARPHSSESFDGSRWSCRSS